MEELRDCHILFDKQPPAFGFFFLIIISIFLILLLAWSIKTPKVYTIQAQGVVTNEGTNYVMCTYTGEIDQCFMEEGMLVKQGDLLFTIKSTDYDLQEEQLEESRGYYEQVIRQNQRLVKSIKNNKNYFDESLEEDSLYYHAYEHYKVNLEQSEANVSLLQAYGYTKEQIEQELIKNQKETEKIYYSAIEEAESTITQAKQQIENIDAQLLAIQIGQSAYEVKATAAGVLHLLDEYKEGMVLQTTTPVATITAQNCSNVLETYVTTADRVRIKVGNEVQMVVDGLSQSVYGTISGRVKSIASGITITQPTETGENKMFRIIIEINDSYLVSQNGEKIDIITGMTAVARIHYDKITYFYYVLEKLGFKAK